MPFKPPDLSKTMKIPFEEQQARDRVSLDLLLQEKAHPTPSLQKVQTMANISRNPEAELWGPGGVDAEIARRKLVMDNNLLNHLVESMKHYNLPRKDK